VTKTNVYDERVKREQKKGPWKETCVEVRVFLGILVIIGICRLPTLDMYWSDNNVDIGPEPPTIRIHSHYIRK